MTGSRSQSSISIELLWALAAVVTFLAVITWRFALRDDSDPPAATPAATSAAIAPMATSTAPAEPFVSCGEELDAPDSALNLEARECLLAAVANGQRVEFNITRPTVEGDPVYWRVRVLARGDIEVAIDNRADEFSGPARRRVVVHHCTTLDRVGDGDPRIDISGCTDGATLRL